ncbi:hypothetical protein L1987_12910 [Smallanthus sonchifolius]|uniref:Uncharacterized protein n=1 Tax=Smallanthus sonchifolius TaxID=185202 RepID=A0ACB9JIJ3_9ASTR|nr:hypothetical protein L1987_12910 [Smallanthus sonchifolius]
MGQSKNSGSPFEAETIEDVVGQTYDSGPISEDGPVEAKTKAVGQTDDSGPILEDGSVGLRFTTWALVKSAMCLELGLMGYKIILFGLKVLLDRWLKKNCISGFSNLKWNQNRS